MSKNNKTLALLLPTKGRFFDLILTLIFTNIKCPKGYRCIFVLCANYSDLQLGILKILFFSKVVILDERELPWRGMTGAYNYAYERAKSLGATWVALWADDLLPEKRRWLDSLFLHIDDPKFQFGIFSSDEGSHKGRYGWNIEAGYPCAHFYIARTDILPGYLLNPKLKAYVGDNEIVITLIKKGVKINLLPLKVIHQPTHNETRVGNLNHYKTDLETVYKLHPELARQLDEPVLNGNMGHESCHFITDTGANMTFGRHLDWLRFDEFKLRCPVLQLPVKFQALDWARRIWHKISYKIVKLVSVVNLGAANQG